MPSILLNLIILNLVIFIANIRCQLILAPNSLHIGTRSNELLCFQLDKCLNKEAIISITFRKEFNHKNNHLNKTIQFYNFKNEIAKANINLSRKDFENFTISNNNNNNNNDLILPKKIYMKIFLKNSDKEISIFNGKFNLIYDSIIYFQTDRPIYQPNDLVKFRALEIDKSFQPKNDYCNLTIKNHQKIKLDFIQLTLSAPYFFAEYEFQLPQRVKEGIWEAELLCNNGYDRLNFEIKNYIKPIININVQTPDIHYCSLTKPLIINITATYTYGKPVNGHLYFKLYSKIPKKDILQTKILPLYNGSILNYQIQNNELPCKYRYNLPINLYIKTILNDKSTDTKQEHESNNIILTSNPYKLSFIHTNIYYRVNIANFIVIDVKNFNNQPVSNVPIKINIFDRIGNEIKTYSITNDFKSDKNGLVIATFSLIKPIGRLKVEAKTADERFEFVEQAFIEFSLYPFDNSNDNNAAIWLMNKKQLYFHADEQYISQINYTDNVNPNEIYLLIISKGFMFHLEKIYSIFNEPIKLNITNRMAPSVRILLLAMTKNNNEIISDSILLYVEQKNCGVNIELLDNDNNNNVYEPGSIIKFNFTNYSPNDIVAMNVVDESIYILRSNNNRKKFHFLINRFDYYNINNKTGGRNSLDIIDTAGFRLLSSIDNNDKIRKKRSTNFDCKLYDHFCCRMALLRSPKSCSERRIIIKKYLKINDTNCLKYFDECCLCRYDDGLQTSSVNRFIETSKSNFGQELNSPPQTQDKDNELLDDEKNTRHDFRDSWLFDLILLKKSDNKFEKRAPHSITSWIISSVSLTARDGFCFSNDLRITTYKPFFIHLSMPKFLLLNEYTEISATIFNYLDSDITIDIYLYKNYEICSEASNKVERSKTRMKILKQSSIKKSYPIIPIRVGTYTIKLKAMTKYQEKKYVDIILKNITINFPGKLIEEITPLDLDPVNRAKRATTTTVLTNHSTINSIINQVYPEEKLQKIDIIFDRNLDNNKKINNNNNNNNNRQNNIILETLRHELLLIGSKFNPTIKTIEELDYLIKKPKGCGEQNMYYMAFNLYTMNYLDKIGKLKEKTELRAKNYLKRALRQQLNFRKDDGSFSAFINRNSSIWLTAFISKVFCHSGNYLSEYMDKDVITKAIEFLLNHQSPDGYWKEIFSILHTEALGGTSQSYHTLTAYILIALNECRNYFIKSNFKIDNNLNEKINLAENYLKNVKQTYFYDDSYSLSIITYSFILSSSYNNKFDNNNIDNRLLINQLIDKLLIHEDKEIDTISNYQFYNNNYSIETTSYVLLSLIHYRHYYNNDNIRNDNRDNKIDLIMDKLAGYLTLQQKDGAFDNTQNTIMALEALTEYYSKIIFNNDKRKLNDDNYYGYKLLANISFDSRPKRSIRITDDNIDILHSVYVDNNIDNVDIVTLGEGNGKFELLTSYNIINPNELMCKFELKIKIDDYHFYNHYNYNYDDHQQFEAEDFFSDTNRVIQEQKINKNDIRLIKRSIWTNLRDKFQSRHSSINQSNNQSTPKATTSKKHITGNECIFNNTSPLNIGMENPIIKIVQLNFRRLTTDKDGMIILEFGLLSGFKVIERDLEFLKELHNDTIYYYNIVDTKIEFYLKSVPLGRMELYCFRIYRKYNVQSLQGALVNIYDYYQKNSKCSKLYEIVDELNVHKCDKTIMTDNICNCKTNAICPRLLDDELRWKFEENVEMAFYLYKKMFCNEYSLILDGQILNKTIITNQNKTLIQLYVSNVIKKDNYEHKLLNNGMVYQFYIDNNCDIFNLLKSDKIIIIIPDLDYNYDFYLNGIRLLDGRTLLKEKQYWIDDLNSLLRNNFC